MLFAAIGPLVWTAEVYQATYGEDDPEELNLMKLEDQDRARAMVEVLQDLFFLAAPELMTPRADEGPQEEVGPVEALHVLRQLAAAQAGFQVDDYYEGRVPPGHLFQHLINHSDADGFYLPQDFPQPFWVEEVSVGSAPALLRDLVALRPVLRQRFPDLMALAEANADEALPATGVDSPSPDSGAGPVRVWQVLDRLCRASMALDLPIAFG